MKVLVLLAFVAVARAGYLGAPAAVVASVAEAGHSNSHRAQDLVGNYNFGYNEAHTTGGSSRQETGDAFGNKVGSYSLTDADGRVRVVKYVADAAGFRASVSTNEPGTAPSTPAAAGYNAPVVAPAPVAAYAAPVAAVATAPVAAYAAPVAAYAAPVAAPVAAYAAPVAKAYAAPVAAYAAPVAAAAHVYGPAVAGYGAYGAYAAPAVYGKALAHGAAYGLGYGAHANSHSLLNAILHKEVVSSKVNAWSSCVLSSEGRTLYSSMQVFVFLALVAVARAGFLGGPAAVAAPAAVVATAVESGHSNTHRSQDLAGNYNFGYTEAHTSGGSSRQESGDAFGNKVGSYSLHDADGRVRVVKYVADAAGFRASVSTNEPGTAPSTPAAAGYNAPVIAPAPQVAVAAAPVAFAAPVAAYAAPVARAFAAPVTVAAAAPVAAYAAPVAHYAAPVAKAVAAPVAAYAANVAAPVAAAHVYGPAVAGYGYAAPVAKAVAAPVAAYAAPVAAGYYGAYAAPAAYAHGAYGLGYGAHVKHFF
ncbi:calphotin-like [Ornithodoros turicata]|uniref:calphotin-like n=1 Tax=Ornithodoros turicata TaxID=34597 RepID=UPI003138E01E